MAILSPLVFPGPAAADCPSPWLEVEPANASPGEVLEVRGEAFAKECNDTSVGCLPPRRSPPITGVVVQLRSGDAVLDEATADAGEGFAFTVELVVPEDAPAGRYEVATVTIEDWDTQPVGITVEP